MTANKFNHATSDNSVSISRRAEIENLTLQRDSRLRSTVQHINNRNGAVTAAKIECFAQGTDL